MSLLGNHRVYFKYDSETINVHQNRKQIKVTRPVISCTIENKDKKLVSKSVVKLHHEDINNKIKGREYAFVKAVNKIGSRDVRKAIHSDFRENLKWINE